MAIFFSLLPNTNLSKGYRYLLMVCQGVKIIKLDKQSFLKAAWLIQYKEGY